MSVSADRQTLRWRWLWLACGWCFVLLIIYLSLRPEGPLLPPSISDKLQHVLAYAVLMSWFTNLYPSARSRAVYACVFIALGIILELIQGRTGYRSFDVFDMFADAVGVAAGWLLAPPRGPGFLAVFERMVLGRDA